MLSSARKLFLVAGFGAFSLLLAPSAVLAAPSDAAGGRVDPCAAIGGQKWVAPSAVRACFQSFSVNETTKSNVSVFPPFFTPT